MDTVFHAAKYIDSAFFCSPYEMVIEPLTGLLDIFAIVRVV